MKGKLCKKKEEGQEEASTVSLLSVSLTSVTTKTTGNDACWHQILKKSTLSI